MTNMFTTEEMEEETKLLNTWRRDLRVWDGFIVGWGIILGASIPIILKTRVDKKSYLIF